MLILFACKFYLQVLGEKNMEMYLHVSWTWSIITIYSGKDKCQIYPSTWNVVPGPKTLDMKQRRLVFPREAKKGRTASVPAYSLKKDSRPWYRKKNPGRARQRKWRSESRVARASIAQSRGWGVKTVALRRKFQDLQKTSFKYSTKSWWVNESSEITQKDSREQCPDQCLFPTARKLYKSWLMDYSRGRQTTGPDQIQPHTDFCK